MSNGNVTPTTAARSPSAAGGIAGSASAAVSPAAAACQGQGAVVLHCGIRGPFDGLIFYLPDGKWLFVHCDGAPVIVADTLGELLRTMESCGFLEDHYLYLQELYLEAHSLSDPIIPLSRVPLGILLAFEKGMLSLEDVAKRVGVRGEG